MAGVTTTTLGALLKRIYGKRLLQMQNKAAFLYKMLPKSIYKPKGAGFYAAVSMQGNQAGGALNESESLKTAGYETVEQAVITPKFNHWPVQITGLARAVSEGDEASFATGLVRQLDEALENLLKDCNRQAFSDGTGKLATCSVTATSATQTFDTVMYLKPGMVVDSYLAGSKVNDSVTINSVDRLNNQATFSASLTLTAAEIIYKEDVKTSAPSDGKEMAGTTFIIDDGTVNSTFQGLSRTTYPIFKGNIIDAGNVDLTNDLLQRATDEVSIVGDGKIDFLIMRHGQRRKYLNLVVSDKRFLDDKLDRGYQYIYWNGLKIYIDVDCPRKEVIGITQKYLERFEVRGIHLADDNNSILKWNGSADVFIAYYRLYANIGSLKPNALFRITNLNEPSGAY